MFYTCLSFCPQGRGEGNIFVGICLSTGGPGCTPKSPLLLEHGCSPPDAPPWMYTPGCTALLQHRCTPLSMQHGCAPPPPPHAPNPHARRQAVNVFVTFANIITYFILDTCMLLLLYAGCLWFVSYN